MNIAEWMLLEFEDDNDEYVKIKWRIKIKFGKVN